MYNAQNKKVKINGSELWYDVFGKGTTPLVMIPGLVLTDVKGTANQMAYFYRRFAKNFRVYIFDKRASGYEGCTIKTLADDIAQAMKQLELSGANVLGVSQGGMIAQRLAIDHPELVGRLMLGVTAARTNPQMREAIDKWVKLAQEGNIGELIRSSNELTFTDKQMKKYDIVMPLIVKLTKTMPMERFIAFAKAVLTCDDIRNDLDGISCPTLVIGGIEDKITTAQASQEIAQRLGCKSVIMENESHAAYLSNKFNRMAYDFFMER